MTGTDLGVLTAAVVGALGLFLGVPQWRMSQRQNRDRHIMDTVRLALVGDRPFAPPGPDNPSAVDQLKDIHALMSDQSEMTAILLHHIADGHGGEQPPWLAPKERR